LKVAQAQVEAAQETQAQAESTVAARQSDLLAAKQQVQAMQAQVDQARAQVTSATDSAAASQAGVASAQATERGAREAIRQAQARHVQAVGQLQQAQTKPRQVAVSAGAQATAQAKVAQAQAALQAALLDLQHTRIYAPVSGQVSAKSVEIGMLAQPLTPLMAIVQSTQLWVVANYKETQLRRARPGQAAEISVDALDGELFHGHVDSLAAATGSSFALLPPDNASGNFTKVVQRVPIRIRLDEGQPDLDRLRAGLSVYATIVIE
jgi:membrane fusion protein, multidrug efflux system